MKTKLKLLLLLTYVWYTVPTTVKAQNLNVKIMSFNVQQPFGTNWDGRKAGAASIFNTTQADVIGTQEAVNYQRDYLAQQTGYAWYGIGRDGGDSGEGSWIFYKANKYTLDNANSGNFWLSDTPTVPSRFAGGYNRICTYVHLIEKSSGKGFYIFNSHFPTPDLPDARLKSMKLLTQRMASRAIPADPIYATGDFNSNEVDAVTIWMKTGADNPTKYRDTYRDVNPSGSVNTGFGTKFDYIYCPNDAKYTTQTSWVITTPVASDHYPIVAEVQFKNENTPPIPVTHNIPGKIEAENYANALGITLENTTDVGAGKNVGYLEVNDWIEYKVNVATAANYTLELRIASTSDSGKIAVLVDGQQNQTIALPLTNGWQAWQTVTKNINLPAGLHTIKFQVAEAGFNINWFNFVAPTPSALAIPGKIEAENYATTFGTQLEDTADVGGGKNVGYLEVNDWLEYKVNVAAAANYTLDVRYASTSDSGKINVLIDGQYNQTIALPLTNGWQAWQTLTKNISLPAGLHTIRFQVVTEGFNLNWFNFSSSTPSNPSNLTIPGKIEAENYAITFGTQLEDTADTGGGKNIGFLDVNDILEYNISVTNTATYTFEIRVASLDSSGRINVLVDNQFIKSIDLPVTGGWQNWQTLNSSINLSQGNHRLKLEVVKGGFNLNWFNFGTISVTKSIENKTIEALESTSFYPNPTKDFINFNSEYEWTIFSISGEKLLSGESQKADVSSLNSGIYILYFNGQQKKLIIN